MSHCAASWVNQPVVVILPRAWFLRHAGENDEPGRNVFARSGSGGHRIPTRLRIFLFDLVATDLISFEADGCNSTGYGPLGDPLLSFTGRDLFFVAPYGDASRLNEDHSPSQASNGLYQLLETHAVTGPSPAQSPLAGLSPSAARWTAQITAPSPSYRGHSGVSGNALTDPSWSRAQRVDDVVREPARLTDNVAAFTDAPLTGLRLAWATLSTDVGHRAPLSTRLPVA
ncbi:hypothetical protein HPB51_029157 [Rhipicephalus microplus]|uniref:Uncharacterized protein n=1 Tax=Rhipicephalus microplus TaxID=6941 RepID=A0A9J6CVA5_RHIMP|nr:hypothetical protein HPB51_029157 [Rhipicephalus microplus]